MSGNQDKCLKKYGIFSCFLTISMIMNRILSNIAVVSYLPGKPQNIFCIFVGTKNPI